MDAFALMKKDHRKVEEIFEDLLGPDGKSNKKRKELFKELKNELLSHAHMEEHVFYPVMKAESKTHDLTMEFYEEHHQVKELLEELEKLSKDDEKWMAKLTVLQENVQHHVNEEENDLFPKAEKILPKERSEELGKEMQESKQEFLSK